MGQEASVPMDPDLEEQARAPPSSTNPPPPTLPPPPPPPGTSSSAAASSLGIPVGGINRALNAATAAVRQSTTSAKQQQQQQQQSEYEARETARAAATGGNLYYLDPAEPPQTGQPFVLEPDAGWASQAASAGAGGGPKSPPRGAGGPPATGTNTTTDSSSNQPVAAVGATGGNSSKRGLFSHSGRNLAHSRGAALIHSMRNLNLGKALGGKGGGGNNNSHGQYSSKQQLDWEKQWDEDVDDDSDDDDEEGEAAAKIPAASALHLKQQGDRDGAMSPFAPAPLPLEVQQLAAPSATVPTAYSSSLESSSGYYRATVGPQDLQSQQQQPVQLVQPQQPEDLLSKPLGAVAAQPLPPAPAAGEDGKPCVEMFLPMLRVLGKGSFGKVVLVQKRFGKERGQLFAMKILKKTYLVKRRQIERTRTERKVLSAVNHPFIMKLHYAFQTEDKLYLVLDYCPGGELFFHLSRCRRFPERVARFYAAELLLAVAHVHKHSIVYRDLKPENILLDADGHVKLGDFGLAKAGITSPIEGAHSMCGTPEYMAPEVLSQQGHGFCVDYWGLGMLTYEMMTGLPPWYTTDRQKLFRRLKSAPLDIPNFFSPAAADCVAALLERNPRRRLGVAGVRSAMEHEFFRNISWRALYARRVEAPIKPCESWKPPDANSNAQTNNGDVVDLLSSPSSTVANLAEIEKIDSGELDAATSNFDATFLRMPVESEDNPVEDPEDAAAAEELHDDTFLGFTFDIREREQRAGPTPQEPTRQRTHHFQQP